MRGPRLRAPSGLLVLGVLVLLLAWTGPARAASALEKGIKLAHAGKFQEALPFLDKAVKARPGDEKPYRYRGWCLLMVGRPEQAVPDFQKAIKLVPRNPDALFNLGEAYRMLGKHAFAEAQYDRTLEIEGNYTEAWFGRAVARLALGQGAGAAADAAEYIRRVGMANGERPLIMAAVAFCGLVLEGRRDEGHRRLRQALQDGDSMEPAMAIIEYLQGQTTAENLLSEARQERERVYAQAFIGLNLALQDRDEEALGYLLGASRRGRPGWAATQLARAWRARIEGE
ncbi:MAG TPA: tetratricopeptide repeat protein [Candidatus Nitrosotenuis sp.]|nr:tetratricopeptide repeat protein [Candidatus Nitrosotenuis sp.]